MVKKLLILGVAVAAVFSMIIVAEGQTGCLSEIENNNNISLADYLDSGECRQGSISPVGDTDWYYFIVHTTRSVRIETTTGHDTHIYLYNASGTTLLESDDDGGAGYASLIVRTLAPGRYYVRVEEHGNNFVVHTYDLRLSDSFEISDSECLREQEDNYTRATADSLAIGGCRQGSISPIGDFDTYYFDVSTSRSLSIETATSGDTIIYLYGASGPLLESDDDGGVDWASLIVRTFEPGRYFILVHDYGNDDTIGTYNVRISDSGCLSEVESNNNSARADYLVRSGCRQGSISPVGDTDWYYFTIDTARSVRIETTTGGDTVIYLYNASGTTLLESDDDGGGDRQSLIVRTLRSGTYYVRVEEFDNNGTIGTYKLIVTLGPG